MTMETVAFYSYKGGVGRTLLVANTAQFLAMSGRRVVALDLDLEAPGLHHKLGSLDRPMRGGAVDELLSALEGEQRTVSLRETAIEISMPVGCDGSLFLIPAGSAPSPAYWASLERLNHVLRSHRRNGGLPEAVLELQARIAEEFDPQFLLIDSRTGITELGGLATSLLADRVVCLTTTSPESVEGIRVVAEALRAAPRLASQKPLRLDFLVTRVEERSMTPAGVLGVLDELGGPITVLPHDSGIANEEQVWLRSRPIRSADPNDVGMVLFAATLRWIASSFPAFGPLARSAERRMRAVHHSLQQLRGSSLLPYPSGWPNRQLRERVLFGRADNSRQADIVAYDSNARPLMIVEYVGNREEFDAAARWWFSQTQIPVVALLGDELLSMLYSCTDAQGLSVRLSERWDLPLPRDFEALADPADASVGSLLDAVRRGYPEYLERIVDGWAVGVTPVAPGIVDELAGLDDIELARRALRACVSDTSDRVVAGLFAPLFWRLSPEASIQVAQKGGRSVGAVSKTVALLAQDTLGLRYDTGTPISFEISTASPPPSPASNGLLGDYQPEPGRVVLYSEAVSQCADRLALRARHVGSVTLIHETLRALAHVGLDLDGRTWPQSELAAADARLFETLVQYFTYRHLVGLRDPNLLRAFEAMLEEGHPGRRAWERIRDLSIEDARSWLLSLRRGAGPTPPPQPCDDAPPGEG
jgi:MinD-like ATPase involved in chromosome partitioning or flagellar assembly